MEDNYINIDKNVFYVPENILGPAENTALYNELNQNFNSQLTNHCVCDAACAFPTCSCLLLSGGDNYVTYLEDGQNGYKLKLKENGKPILECNSICQCKSNCCNRVVQKGPIQGLEIRKCIKGYGLYTTIFIPKGIFLCEYAGELITRTEAFARYKINQQNGKMNYIFCLKEHCNEEVMEIFVDPSQFGNIGRYINHSCMPNCHIVPVRSDCPIPKLAIFAQTDIYPNEEISFHYGSDNLGNVDKSTPNLVRCLCKTKNCNGFMPFQYY